MPKYDNANSWWIAQNSRGKRFVDVGCMWGVQGDYSLLAEQSGASEIVGIDIYEAQQEFQQKLQKAKSRIKFIQCDVNDGRTPPRVCEALGGKADLVFCSGVLYHVPDPIHTVRQLGRMLSAEGLLILNTMTIPEQAVPCSSVLFSGLPESVLSQFALGREGVGLSQPFLPKQGYANWVWGMSPSCVREVLRLAGFMVIDEDLGSQDECYAALCKRDSSTEFHDDSGAWSDHQGAKVFA